MKSGRRNNEAGIQVTHTRPPNRPRSSFTLNSTNHRQGWREDPWHRSELLPKAGKHQLDVETENEGDWDHLLEIEDIQHHTFKLLLLVSRQGESVDTTNGRVGEDEDDEVDVN